MASSLMLRDVIMTVKGYVFWQNTNDISLNNTLTSILLKVTDPSSIKQVWYFQMSIPKMFVYKIPMDIKLGIIDSSLRLNKWY